MPRPPSSNLVETIKLTKTLQEIVTLHVAALEKIFDRLTRVEDRLRSLEAALDADRH